MNATYNPRAQDVPTTAAGFDFLSRNRTFLYQYELVYYITGKSKSFKLSGRYTIFSHRISS